MHRWVSPVTCQRESTTSSSSTVAARSAHTWHVLVSVLLSAPCRHQQHSKPCSATLLARHGAAACAALTEWHPVI